jgi:hypothetical protein
VPGDAQGMTTRGSRRLGGTRQVPLDHLRPGGEHPSDPTGAQTDAVGGSGPAPADPVEPAAPAETTGVGVEGEAVRGKATRSPAEVATRPHLEGSEQGPA